MFSKSRKGHISELVSYAGFFIGADIEAEGDITTDEDIFIDGRFKGTITTPSAVELGQNSHINGAINARSINIDGYADIQAKITEKTTVTGCANLRGNIEASQINIETGARINAKLIIGKK